MKRVLNNHSKDDKYVAEVVYDDIIGEKTVHEAISKDNLREDICKYLIWLVTPC